MPARLKSLEFILLDSEIVKNIARVRIVNSELYDADGYPIEGGVMDPRLGVIDPGLYCRTCNCGIGECMGHFGYLEFARPVINVLYVKIIHELMKKICWKCSRLINPADIVEETSTQPSKCSYCDAVQRKVKFVKPYTFYEDGNELDALTIRERFEKIPAGDTKTMGFNGGRPEWLIMTLFPIPPVTMRPSITLETGERSEDDLTHKLVDIVRINQSLKENIDIGAPEFIIRDLWELLQYHVSTYFDNELTGAPLARHRSGRPLKGIIQRLKAKEGRLRGNLLGKRVNFSARTVIAPDPRLSINEVGVPELVAKEITIPVSVTSLNTGHVKQLIKEGLVNYVTRPDGRKIKVTEDNKKEVAENISLGWSIDRQLMDSDVVIFNRQPSLHRPSIMAHRVRVMPGKAFRINPSVCFPYNADFDGDEMNLHALQNEEARTESTGLMLVENNIISPKFGGPIIGLDLDQLSGSYLLTANDVEMTREEACQLLAFAGIDIVLPEKKTFSGKEIFSFLLPGKFSMEHDAHFAKSLDSKEKEKQDGIVTIRDSMLARGRVDEASVGAESGYIIGRIIRLFGNAAAAQFIDNAARLATSFLLRRGFSAGLSDLDLPERVKKDIKGRLQQGMKHSEDLISQYKEEELEILPGMTPEESLETHILNALSKSISDVSTTVSLHIKESDIVAMAKSGAKGSFINISQMIAGVGQETILGERINSGYIGRTLPHFMANDLSATSRGFVGRGFREGLMPYEIFWDIMNGREGLMDKSLRTRKSGYMQRRLVNALQDLKVKNDLTVRNSVNEIVQFKAGEDGMDVSKTDFGTLNWKSIIEQEGL
ncbi:MAG: DNA-directed RNA polymerase subunit A' [Candidatus Aenigmarchaeota archaeon]|nr:DNA-directed RNA polymerase subunit A' [Candidatus Aenigmarchaeota archaeon]